MSAHPPSIKATIKAAYFRGEGSLRALSERYGVPLRSLERWCSGERWRHEIKAIGGAVTAAAVQAATEVGREAGQQLAGTATAFLQRTKDETQKWMDRIEGLADSGGLTPQTLKALVDAWRSTVEVGREAHGLDSERSGAIVNVAVLASGADLPQLRPAGEPVDAAGTNSAVETTEKTS